MPRSYWDWHEIIAANNAAGFFPYTPATNMLYGLSEAMAMLHEEGLERCLPGISALRPRPAPPSPIGTSKCCASNRANIRRS